MTTKADTKIVRYLGVAHAEEAGWADTLKAHIAMTPTGSYRNILERQASQAKRHASQIKSRLADLGEGNSLFDTSVGIVKGLVGHVLAAGWTVTKAPLGLVSSGGNGEEKMLGSAIDEAPLLERGVLSFRALAHFAEAVEDTATADLAEAIADEKERGLRSLEAALDGLVDAVVRAEIHGRSSYDPSTTGAAQSAHELVDLTDQAADSLEGKARSVARQARKVPGVAQVEGEIKGALADEDDLRIADYDDLTADDIVGQLTGLSQIELAKIDAYERKNDNRSTVTSKITALRGDEPWPGYDELTVVDIRKALTAGGERLARTVTDYERRHKGRQGVLDATQTVLANT